VTRYLATRWPFATVHALASANGAAVVLLLWAGHKTMAAVCLTLSLVSFALQVMSDLGRQEAERLRVGREP
jgi:hypothetical protein